MKDLTFIDSVKDMPLMKLPVRTCLIRLRCALILLTPVSALRKDKLAALGRVTDVIAPNLWHLDGVPLAGQVFERARLWGPVGAHQARPEVNWFGEISERDWPCQDELPCIPLRGMPELAETAFVHRESRTLFLTDLVFNRPPVSGAGAWLALHFMGVHGRFAIPRPFLKKIENPRQLQHSLNELFTFDFENIVMSHGEVVRGGGRRLLLGALEENGLAPAALKKAFIERARSEGPVPPAHPE